MVSGLINPNPVVHQKKECRVRNERSDADEFALEPIDQLEIFDILLHVFPLMQTYCVIHN